FVPAEPSIYRDHMHEGDRQFRRGMYVEALGAYEVALAIFRRGPEIHLSLAQVNLALGNYYTGCHHIQEALKYFPELPLANISLADFYGQKKDLQVHREKLLKRLADVEVTGHEWLLVAYVHYYSGNKLQAAIALRRAFVLARRYKNEALIEAASIFWDGMVAAGKVTGHLDPARRSTTAATTRPANSKADRSPSPALQDPPAPR
ncbi:hypothetical protein LCGC14_1343050, partial [marine sediment metagenome]